MGKLSRFVNLAKHALGQALGDEDSSRERGRDDRRQQAQRYGDQYDDAARARAHQPSQGAGPGRNTSDRADVARYAYLLQTAPPRQLEQVHREAFAKLSPAQRDELRSTLEQGDPVYGASASSSPQDLAVAATRVQSAHPGTLQRILGGASRNGSRGGLGKAAVLGGAGLAAGGILTAVAGGAVLSSVGGTLLQGAEGLGVDFAALSEGLDPAAFGLESLGELGLDNLTGDLGGLADVGGLGEQVSGLGEQAAGLGEQVGGLGEQLGQAVSDFQLPDLGDFFKR